MSIDFSSDNTHLPSPCYIVDEALLVKNLEVLSRVQEQAGCKILLAQKGFSMFALYPLIGRYLAGTAASGLFEARLGYEEMGKEVHTYSPAYREDEFDEILGYSDHIVFNTLAQWHQFKSRVQRCAKPIECGIRINPEYAEIEHDLYNPCFAGSRLGTTLSHFDQARLDGITGIHFHAMCEQGADTLERILQVVEKNFAPALHRMKWLNFGGGHHITRSGYDVERLVCSINRMKETYGLQIYLEPGEAVALNTGFLVTTVLDTLKNGIDIAILDSSAACHAPDVLEMPYRPDIIGAARPGEKRYTYRLGGPTCLAGDIFGDYSFDTPLKPGDRLMFCDMAHYSMVKNNTFNGMPLPAIAVYRGGTPHMVKTFGYDDFKMRLS